MNDYIENIKAHRAAYGSDLATASRAVKDGWRRVTDPNKRIAELEAEVSTAQARIAELEAGRDHSAFSASHTACYLYPGKDQQAERAAFIDGAARAGVPLAATTFDRLKSSEANWIEAASNALARAETAESALQLLKGAGEWRGMGEAEPRAGNYISVRTIQTYRWLPYKPDGARQTKRSGRWQAATEYGWANAELPMSGDWQPNSPDQQPDTQGGGE